MLIIRQIFHISTRYFSRLFSIGLCLISQPFIGSLFFWVAREVFFLLPHHITAYMFVAAIAHLLFFWWYLLDVMIFCGAILFFFVLGALSRVCRLFALFSPCWLPINTFFSFAFPRCRRSVPMFSVVFQRFMWNIVVFSMKYCLFSVRFLQYPGRYSVVFGALFFWFLRVDTRFYAACTPIVYYWHLLGGDVVA